MNSDGYRDNFKGSCSVAASRHIEDITADGSRLTLSSSLRAGGCVPLVRLAGLCPLTPIISRSEYKMVMSRVLSKESNKIIESGEVTGCRQQNPVAMTNP